jgi:hypothetical protein
MKKKKAFDCVEMKYKIQERMKQEFKGFSDEEIRARLRMEERNSQSPISKKWRRLEKKAVLAGK